MMTAALLVTWLGDSLMAAMSFETVGSNLFLEYGYSYPMNSFALVTRLRSLKVTTFSGLRYVIDPSYSGTS